MCLAPSCEQVDFLKVFFPDGTPIGSWETMDQRPNVLAALDPLIARYAKGESFLLPRKVYGVEEVCWYGFAFKQSQFRELWDDLLAHVGPTYSTFDGRAWELDPSDAFDTAILAAWPNRYVLKFRSGVTPAQRVTLRNRLLAMLASRDSRPPRHPSASRPVGQVLRDMEMALRGGDHAVAEMFRDEALATGVLSAHNQLFLGFRFLQAREDWQGILDCPAWGTVLDVVRPPRITECLLEALYREHYQVLEQHGDGPTAVAFCRSTRGRYGKLMNSCAGIFSPAALRCFLIDAAARDDRRSFERVMEQLPPDVASGDFCQQLRSMLAPPTETEGHELDDMNRARSAYFRGDFEGCLGLLEPLPPTSDVLTILSRCVIHLGTTRAYASAVDRIDEAGEDAFRQCLDSAGFWREWADFEERMNQESGSPVCPDWLTWISLLGVEDVGWQDLRDLAVDLVREEAARALVQDDVAVCGLVRGLSQAETQAARYAVPFLVEAFLDATGPHPAFVPLYLLLIEHLVLGDAVGRNDSLAISHLAIACLCGSVSPEESTALADLLDVASDRMVTWDSLDLVLDVTDALVVHRHPPEPVAQALYSRCLRLALSNPLRLTPGQIAMLRLLAADLTEEDLIAPLLQRRSEAHEDSPSVPTLTGRRLLVYTLTESAGRRAVDILERGFTPEGVVLNTSQAGNDQLRQQAQNADVCVMVTWSATHAATEFIQANLRKDAVLLRPIGKGTSSIVSAVEDYLRSIQDNR